MMLSERVLVVLVVEDEVWWRRVRLGLPAGARAEKGSENRLALLCGGSRLILIVDVRTDERGTDGVH